MCYQYTPADAASGTPLGIRPPRLPHDGCRTQARSILFIRVDPVEGDVDRVFVGRGPAREQLEPSCEVSQVRRCRRGAAVRGPTTAPCPRSSGRGRRRPGGVMRLTPVRCSRTSCDAHKRAERVAARGEFADEVAEVPGRAGRDLLRLAAARRSAARRRPSRGRSRERAGRGTRSGRSSPALRLDVHLREHAPCPSRFAGDDVEASVLHDRRHVVHRVDQLLHPRPDPLRSRGARVVAAGCAPRCRRTRS